MQTTLTPALREMFSSSESGGHPHSSGVVSETLRALVRDALSKGIVSSACFIAEKLMLQPDVTAADVVLFSKTYFANGEPRRCLALLEHKGMLSAQRISSLSLALSPRSQGAPSSSSSSSSSLVDNLSAIHLAAQCLFSLEQYSDCIHLLEPIVYFDRSDAAGTTAAVERARNSHGPNQSSQINIMASIYSIVGRCFDVLDNSPHAISAFIIAIRIDPSCIEVVDYISTNGLLSKTDRKALFFDVLNLSGGHEWLEGYYRLQLLDDGTSEFRAEGGNHSSNLFRRAPPDSANKAKDWSSESCPSPMMLVRRAEHLFERHCPTDAYRLARQAYTVDPFDSRGLIIYIATMVELGLKTELFYLGHELANNYPKMAISWYAVGCYYFICKKLELAQKYLQKSTKINKRFAKAWIALGHVLAAQEESEHAISAFRSASRLLPGDHRPLILMAKELVRTNYLSLALHILTAALQLSPKNAIVLNEIGVIYLKQNDVNLALENLSAAVASIKSSEEAGDEFVMRSPAHGCAGEVYNNYATALRRSKRFEEALTLYQLCLSLNPSDAGTHASIGFTLHLSQRFDEAINAYHKALALQPTFTFCSEMLSRAMEDSISGLDCGTGPLSLPTGESDSFMDQQNTNNSFSRFGGLSGVNSFMSDT